MKPTDQARWDGIVDSWLAQGWVTEGLVTNPAANAILADTGPLPGGWYNFTIILTASAAYLPNIALQHRNTLNDANIAQHYLRMLGQTNFTLPILNYKVTTQERFRLQDMAGGVCTLYGSIIYTRRA